MPPEVEAPEMTMAERAEAILNPPTAAAAEPGTAPALEPAVAPVALPAPGEPAAPAPAEAPGDEEPADLPELAKASYQRRVAERDEWKSKAEAAEPVARAFEPVAHLQESLLEIGQKVLASDDPQPTVLDQQLYDANPLAWERYQEHVAARQAAVIVERLFGMTPDAVRARLSATPGPVASGAAPPPLTPASAPAAPGAIFTAEDLADAETYTPGLVAKLQWAEQALASVAKLQADVDRLSGETETQRAAREKFEQDQQQANQIEKLNAYDRQIGDTILSEIERAASIPKTITENGVARVNPRAKDLFDLVEAKLNADPKFQEQLARAHSAHLAGLRGSLGGPSGLTATVLGRVKETVRETAGRWASGPNAAALAQSQQARDALAAAAASRVAPGGATSQPGTAGMTNEDRLRARAKELLG